MKTMILRKLVFNELFGESILMIILLIAIHGSEAHTKFTSGARKTMKTI